jgi:hypothetical protein
MLGLCIKTDNQETYSIEDITSTSPTGNGWTFTVDSTNLDSFFIKSNDTR